MALAPDAGAAPREGTCSTGKIPAISRSEAHRFLQNRHPNAVLVEVGE
jgi:hypothetical protein